MAAPKTEVLAPAAAVEDPAGRFSDPCFKPLYSKISLSLITVFIAVPNTRVVDSDCPDARTVC